MEALQLEADVELRRAAIIEKLAREAPLFKTANDRVKRAEGLDSSLNRSKEMSLKYIDGLLDKLSAIELESIPVMEDPPKPPPPYPEVETTTGGWLRDQSDGRGTE